MPKTGLEPVRSYLRGILSPLRLPIPPLRQVLEAPPGFEPGDKGFAGLCLTTWLWRLNKFILAHTEVKSKCYF